MATSSSRARSATVFPEGTGTFFRRRLIELGGIAIIALGLALALALLTFHADDPSLNVATDRAARNLIGLPGAYVADFLLQALGAAAFLFAITIIVWGVRISRHCGLRRTWLRITLLPIAVLACAFALATIEKPDSWPLQSGLGGFAGEIGVKRLAQMAANAGIEGGFWLPSLVTGLLGLAAFAVSLGFSPDEWRAAGRAIGRGMVLSQRQAARGGAIAIKAGAAGGRFLGRRIRDARGSDRARIEPTMSAKGTRRQRVAEVEEDEIDSEEIDGDETSSDELTDRLPPVAPGKLIDSPKPRRERRGRGRQTALDLKSDGEARLPSLELLQEPDKDSDDPDVDETALAGNARLLESVLNDFGVNGRIIKVRPGPVVTLYELEPAPGTKTSRVIGLADDIARSMSAVSVRIAVIPGRNVIGIELPNRERRMVLLRELLLHDSFGSGAHRLLLALGKDIGGAPVVVDLARMPHLLVAGTTGSGKSVALNTMILSLLYRLTPAECRFIMIDPKMLELSVYDGIPHLLAPVVTDPPKAVSALKWTVREMEERYRAMSKLGVRNIASYNARLAEARKANEVLTRTVQTGFDKETGKPIYEEQPLDLSPLPLIVVVVDEMADLMLVAGKEIESAVQRLSQMARAAGIHLIMATQRPSVDVITGTIKANFPTRISFQVTSRIDSRTILGEPGAEQLLGQGDMLYMAGGGRITRVHGPLVTDAEVERVVEFLRDQGTPDYVEAVTETAEPEFASDMESGDADPLFDQAVALVLRERKASTSFVQRHLQIGYNRAARIIDRMEAEGLIGSPNHVGKREILMRRGDE